MVVKLIYLCNEVSKRNGWCVINYYTVLNAKKAGHDVTVLTAKNAENEVISGIDYHQILFDIGQLRKDPKSAIRSLFQVRKIFKKEKPDLAHILVEPYLIYFAFLSRPRLVLTIVGTYAISIFQQSGLKLLYKVALRRAKSLIAISQYTADRFRRLVSEKRHIDVVTLGVDFDAFQAPSRAERELAFSFVGYIKPRKGLIYAIKAIHILKQSYPEIKLYVVGLFDDPGYGRICTGFISQHQLEKNVIFLGRLPHQEVKELYARSIMNLLPSYNSKEGSFEGFGLIHLEANAASTLTLGSKETGNESAIIDGKTGFLVQQENEHELASKMREAIEIYKNGKYDTYAKNCRDYARANSWEAYFKNLEAKYLELMK